MKNPKILDIGAGCGRYSISLADEGYDVTAIELVKHNLRVIEKNSSKVKAYQGNATDLSKFKNNSFDLVLLFGPMYHLINKTDKIKALIEAKRVAKPNGIIMVSYCMNDFCILKHGFMDQFIKQAIEDKKINSDYHVISKDTDLYSVLRLEEIDELNNEVNLDRIKIITPDGLSDLIRPFLNKMDDFTFNEYKNYIYSICEKKEMLGFSSHSLDILKKID
jgi:ubiquinone/menaquinone biosynthesis C-methylase UbiE